MKLKFFQNPHLNGADFFHSGSTTGILLFHGFTATTVEVRGLAEFFTSHGFTVHAPLLPGHRTSPEDLNKIKMEQWLECAQAAFNRLASSTDQIVVGGESMGALLALYLGSQFRAIRALLLYSPALLVRKNNYAKYLKYFLKYYKKILSDEDSPWQGYTVYPLRAADEMNKLQRKVARLLESIIQPAIVFQGKNDQTIDEENGEYIYQGISSAVKELVYLENSGHVMLLDKERDKIFTSSLDFLTSNQIL